MARILIVSGDPQSELSLAFERALRFLINEKEYKIECVSYGDHLDSLQKNENYSPPNILLVLNKDTDGIGFLKEYWAELILKRKSESPSVILMPFDNLQELIRRDPQNIFLCSKSVTLLKAPFSLKNIIKKIEMASQKKNDIEEIRQCLLWSCKLGERKLTHALKNYAAPYSLLVGARYSEELGVTNYVKELCERLAGELGQTNVNNIDVDEIMLLAVANLEQRDTSKELKTHRAARYKDFKDWPQGTSKGEKLYKILEGKNILLIDDEWESAKWKDTLEIIFGKKIDAIGDRNWKNTQEVMDSMDSKLKPDNYLLPYDLILLDLYLIEKDHKISDRYAQGEVTSEELKKLSSYKVIEKIRQKDKSVPILLFTATEKAYNVEIMRRVGADDYFPKEIHYEEEKAKEYYKRFKNSIEQLLSYQRRALREIWRGIKEYQERDSVSKKVTPYLILAYQSFSHRFYRCCILEIGNVLERLYETKYRSEGGKDILNKYEHQSHKNWRHFTAFICYKIRTAAKHPSFEPTFEDALLSFLLVLKVLLGRDTFNIPISDPCSILQNLKSTAELIVESVCRVCNKRERCSIKKANEICNNSTDLLKKAMYLSRFENLTSKVAKNNHILFVYLYYILKCFKEKWGLSHLQKTLIKHKITKGGKFRPPITENKFWKGIVCSNGVSSPLGELGKNMYQKKSRDSNGNVFFTLTENFWGR